MRPRGNIDKHCISKKKWRCAMNTTRRLWLGLTALLIAGFGVLLWMGGEIHRQQPPIPGTIATQSGQVLFTRDDIETGRTVWQSIGGQQLGSIWGHGALVAPAWQPLATSSVGGICRQ